MSFFRSFFRHTPFSFSFFGKEDANEYWTYT